MATLERLVKVLGITGQAATVTANNLRMPIARDKSLKLKPYLIGMVTLVPKETLVAYGIKKPVTLNKRTTVLMRVLRESSVMNYGQRLSFNR